MHRLIFGVLACWLVAVSAVAQPAPQGPPGPRDPRDVLTPVPDYDYRTDLLRPRTVRDMALAPDPCVGRNDGPCAFPRFNPGGVQHAGQITIPGVDSRGMLINYGAGAAGFSEDGTRIFVGCRQKTSGAVGQDGRGMIWTGTVPAVGGVSKEIAPCTGLAPPALYGILPPVPGETCGDGIDNDGVGGPDNGCGYFPLLGGVIERAGRVMTTGYVTYDANGTQPRKTWWVGPNLASLTGPVEGSVRNGLVMRGLSRVPPEWQALLGGDTGVEAGYSSIISRASYGPSFSVFSAKDVGTPGFPIHFLLGCPTSDPATGAALPQCASLWQHNSPPDRTNYGGAEESAGVFIAPGTRTLVALYREAKGPMCYGYTTPDQSLHGTEHPGADPAAWCWSLSDPPNEKGPKGYPYEFVALLYDLADLVEVKQGRKKPWNVRPYATHVMPTSNDAFRVGYTGSYAFNALTGTHYLLRELYPDGTGGGKVDVFTGFPREGASQPPPPTHTRARAIGADSAWQSQWIANAKATLSAGAPKLAGKVLHIGDSMTVSQAYGAWAIGAAPAGATAEDVAALKWMRASEPAPANGWHLSWQAVTARDNLAWQSSLIDGLLTDARTKDAQYVVWQLHTPDADPRNVSAVEARITQFAAAGIVSVLTTVPTRVGAGYDASVTIPYNAAIRALAQRMGVPLIDLYDEIVQRRPNGTWAGTLIDTDGVHLSGRAGGYDWASNPYTPGGNADGSVTGDATLNSGYLLRTWLTAAKLGQIHALVGDVRPNPCVTDPVLLSGIAWPGNSEGARSGRFVWSVATAVATLAKAEWFWAPQRLTVTDSRGCSATVTR